MRATRRSSDAKRSSLGDVTPATPTGASRGTALASMRALWALGGRKARGWPFVHRTCGGPSPRGRRTRRDHDVAARRPQLLIELELPEIPCEGDAGRKLAAVWGDRPA